MHTGRSYARQELFGKYFKLYINMNYIKLMDINKHEEYVYIYAMKDTSSFSHSSRMTVQGCRRTDDKLYIKIGKFAFSISPHRTQAISWRTRSAVQSRMKHVPIATINTDTRSTNKPPETKHYFPLNIPTYAQVLGNRVIQMKL